MTINLGLKRSCVACAAKFYDLGKNPAKCPKCATVNDINIVARKRGRVKAAVAADADDPLLAAKAKMEVRQAKAKKPTKKIDGVDLDAFEDIEPIAGDDEIEEIEEQVLEDVESLEEIEEESDGELEDALEKNEMGDEVIVDDVDDLEEEYDEEDDEDEDEEDDSSARKKPVKPAKKAASKPPAKKPATKPIAKKTAKNR